MPDDDDPSLVGEGLTIGQASELLNVPAPTLRSWELRYGLPTTTQRGAGRHRRYRSAELTQLRLMRDEIAIGRQAADAARWVRDILDEHNPGRNRISQLLDGSRAEDAEVIRAILDGARDELGLGAAIDDVALPAMRQIGAWWQTGRYHLGQERHTTDVVRAWMAKEVTLGPAPDPGPPVLLATGPRDLHTLGLEALAALLAQRRIGCRIVGRPLPARELADVTSEAEAAAVVVVSHLPSQRRSAVESVHAVADTGVPTFYAGHAFLLPAARKTVRGTYLGESIAAAATLVGDVLQS